MLKEDINRFLEYTATYSPSAARNYRPWLERFDELTRKDISDLTIEDYVRFKAKLELKYAPKTVSLACISVRMFLKFNSKIGVSCLNFELIKIPHVESRSYDAITREDFLKMLSVCKVDTYKELQKTIMLRMLWDTGVRVSELCDLNIESIKLPHSYGTIVVKKNRQIGLIFWSKTTNDLLKRYLGVRLCLNQQPALFQGIRGSVHTRRISVRSVQRVIKEIARLSGITKRIHPHSFRHGRGQHIIDLGGDISDVQQILHHMNPLSSFVYLRRNNERLHKRALKFLS